MFFTEHIHLDTCSTSLDDLSVFIAVFPVKVKSKLMFTYSFKLLSSLFTINFCPYEKRKLFKTKYFSASHVTRTLKNSKAGISQ